MGFKRRTLDLSFIQADRSTNETHFIPSEFRQVYKYRRDYSSKAQKPLVYLHPRTLIQIPSS